MSGVHKDTQNTANSWLDLALSQGGRSLIEASAGTGKTWTIAVLYLRLLLEEELSPRQIVVATFTEAAAQELRERIRLRVHDAARWSSQAARGELPSGDDGALDWLRHRWSSVSSPDADLKRLQLALAEVDGAPIGTLHSLCQRILRDYPFETRSQFEPAELNSGQSMLAECARDLLRRDNMREGAVEKLPSLGELEQQLKVLLRPGISVPIVEPDAIRANLPHDAAERIASFANDTTIYTRTATGKPQKTLGPALLDLAKWCGDSEVTISDAGLGHLSNIQQNLLPEAWERFHDGPELTLVADILSAYQLVQDAPTYREWADRQKQAMEMCEQRLLARNQMTFDSLLTRTHAALLDNPSLAAQLCEAWPVGLIDEFQDTDGLQYGVLDAIYRTREGGLRGRLVMIGDPKQAIYSFRGGDIDTYRRAAESVTDQLVLDTNYRSDPRLVQAFNELYTLCGTELSARDSHDIRYSDVKWGVAAKRYLIDGAESLTPFAIHYLADCPDSASERRSQALAACASHIAQMLASGKHHVNGRPLQPGDIAVLLPTHDAVATLREGLLELGVPSVGAGRASVFGGEWAKELQVILHAVQHPHSAPLLQAALATRLGGMDFGGLQAMRSNPGIQADVSKQYEVLRERWTQCGVLAVVREVLSAAAGRLLACHDGERAMTDVRHLGELLQDAEEGMHGPTQLLAWLACQREEAAARGDAEESQLRMESDARRVQLMTLHASKGLEFPVVFLPLMWTHAARGNETPLLPDEGGGRKVSFGAQAQRLHQQAAQDERFRVLYVALTRAQHACHVYALSPGRRRHGGAETPLGDPERSALDATIARLMRATADGQSLPKTSALGWSEGWPWTPPPPSRLEVLNAPEHKVRAMPKRVPVLDRLHSFSSLSQGRYSSREEQPAADEDVESLSETGHGAAVSAEPKDAVTTHPMVGSAEADAELKRLSWVRGAEFGNALHQVFEERRIGKPMADQHALIDAALTQNGVRLGEMSRADAIARISQRIQATLDADLGAGLRLGAIPARALRAEMAFHYAVNGARISALRNVCESHGVAFPETSSRHLHGLMHGKIDLVFEHAGQFHVLDYKGNQLGSRESGGELSDYDRPCLDKVMAHHYYELQALFYTVAVDRMLRGRVAGYHRNQHLGDAIYLFVRAAGLAPGAGVWRHRFSDELLNAVDHVLGGGLSREGNAPMPEEVEV